MANDEVEVSYQFSARFEIGGAQTMSREKYHEWCKRLDSAKGFETTDLVEELISELGLRIANGDLSDFEVDDFEVTGGAKP